MVEAEGHPFRLIALEDSGFRQGIIKPLNSAIRAALADKECEHVFTLSNDHYAYRMGWMRAMVEKMESDPNIGCLGGQQMNDHGNCGTYYQISQKDGQRYPTDSPYWDTFEMDYNDVSRGFCLLRADMLRKLGLFDENLGTGSFENYDYYIRLTQAGYRSVLWGKIVYEQCVHGNMDLPVDSMGHRKFWDQEIGHAYFRMKWGVRPGVVPAHKPNMEGAIW